MINNKMYKINSINFEDIYYGNLPYSNNNISAGKVFLCDFVEIKQFPSSFLVDSVAKVMKDDNEILQDLFIMEFGSTLRDSKDTEPSVTNPRNAEGKPVQSNMLSRTKSVIIEDILEILKSRMFVLIDGNYLEIERLLRSTSKMRVGGTMMCNMGLSKPIRNMIGLGIIDEKGDEKEFSSTKWEATLALSATSSIAIKTKRPWRIAVVPDVQREVQAELNRINEYTEEEVESARKNGKDIDPYNISKEINGKMHYYKYHVTCKADETVADTMDSPRIRFDTNLQDKYKFKSITIETVDGCGICTPEAMQIINNYLQLTDKEAGYNQACQFRIASYGKGMLCVFDIVGWCNEHNITHLVDIYGRKFDPREMDMILPKSVFKGADLFRINSDNPDVVATSMREFYKALYTPVTINGNKIQLFEDHEWLRVANINQEKKPQRETNYQALQALMSLKPDSLAVFSKKVTDLAERAIFDNVQTAQSFLNMVQNDNNDDFKGNLNDKVSALLAVHPNIYEHKMVKNALMYKVEDLINDMGTKGKLPLYGNFQFAVGDLSLLFYNTPENASKNGEPLTEDNLEYGILSKGDYYTPRDKNDTEEDRMSVIIRNPIIHWSEPGKIKFTVNELYKRWFGHLKGILVFNSYDLVAISAGGMDYDGDKPYKTEEEVILDGVKDETSIVVSPLEGYSAPKKTISYIEAHLDEIDKNSLDNKTGLYTDYATYFINLYYHIEHDANFGTNSKEYIDAYDLYTQAIANGSKEGIDCSAQNCIDVLKLVKQEALNEIEYKIFMLRIASAGEIDFPKHGARFCLPHDCTEVGLLQWKNPERFAGANYKRKMNQQEPHPVLNSPMQNLYNACVVALNKIKERVKAEKFSSSDVSSVFDMNQVYVDKAEYSRIRPAIEQIYANYKAERETVYLKCKEISRIYGATNLATELRSDLYADLYNKYREAVAPITTDLKVLGRVTWDISTRDSRNALSASDLMFVVAFEGVLMNFADISTQAPRIIQIPYLDKLGAIRHSDFSGSIVVEGGINIHKQTGIKVELDLELPDGEYNVFANKGIHYISIYMNDVDKQKQSVISNYYVNSVKSGKVLNMELAESIAIPTNITGITYNGFKSTNDAVALIEKHNYNVTIKPLLVKGELVPSVVCAGRNIGIIDKNNVFDFDNNVNANEYIGKILKINIKKVNKNSLMTELTYHKINTIFLDEVEERFVKNQSYYKCNLVSIEDLGYNVKQINIRDYNKTVGGYLGDVDLECEGRLLRFGITYNGTEYLVCNQLADLINKVHRTIGYSEYEMNLRNTILRNFEYELNKRILEEEKRAKAIEKQRIAEETQYSNFLESFAKELYKSIMITEESNIVNSVTESLNEALTDEFIASQIA